MESFYYRNKLIKDIEKFCVEHNTKMIKYKAYRQVIKQKTGQV